MSNKIILCIVIPFLLAHFVNGQRLFSEVSTEIGVDYNYLGTDLQMAGAGLVVIDVNNDGWEDFYQCGGVFDSKLWLNNKGKFIDASKEYGFEALNGYFVQGAVSFDFNNDGYQDLFIANYGTGMERGDKKGPVLMLNKRGKRFYPMNLNQILPIGDYTSVTVSDVNKDGFTDVFLTNYVYSMGEIPLDSLGVSMGYDVTCLENRLLLNEAGKTFKECAKTYAVNDAGCGLAAHFSDIDRDGDQDLLLANDFGMWTGIGNKYYRNDYPEAHFTDLSDSFGFNHQMYGMCIASSDYDRDADLDYYVTNIGENYFLHLNDNHFFNDAKTKQLDITYVRDSIRGTSWSALFFDYEFDGDQDLYIAKGNVLALTPKTSFKDPNKFYINQNGTFEDHSAISGVDDIISHRGAAFLDYDHDGDLDIVSNVAKLPWAVFAKLEQKIKVFNNNSEAGQFIQLKLIGENEVNKDCFGCTVVSNQKGIEMMQEVDGGSGHASQSTRYLYVGLGSEYRLDKLTVNWTNATVSTFENLSSEFNYTIYSSGKIVKTKKK